MIINQLSVFLENRAGQLSEITGLLAQNGIDLKAANIAETSDYGILRIITENPLEAKKILKDNGFVVSSCPVLLVTIEDKPGGLSRLLVKLNDNAINIEYMYSMLGSDKGKAVMVIKCEESKDPQEVEKLIAQ